MLIAEGKSKMEICIMMIVSMIIIISFLFYSKVYINFKYRRDGANDDIVVDVSMFKKLLRYNMQIPIIQIMDIENSFWLTSKIKTGKSQDQTQPKRERRFIRKTVNFYIAHPGRIRHIIRIFRYCARLYYRVMGNVITSLYCEQLEWKTRYGSEDAAITGIATGVLWTIKALMVARLKKHVIFIKQPIITVDPVFGDNSLKVDFQCIFSIRLGNVINTIRDLYVIK